MKQEKPQEPLDITEHFALHGAPIEPSPNKLFGDGGTDTFDGMTPHPSWQLAPAIDVPEPIISIADMGYYAAILLNGMGMFYIGTLIGNALAYLLR